MTHHEKFTEKSYGWDYDRAMQDSGTRLHRIVVKDLDSLNAYLRTCGIKMDMLAPASSFDSCLLNSPIDAYLALPHLQNDESSDSTS